MESVQLAEQKLDTALRYLEENQTKLFGNDVACVRHRLNAILKSNSGTDMINTARTSIEQCLTYWRQTPDHHEELQQTLEGISAHLDTIWEQRSGLKSELNETQQRVARKINAFLSTFIQREDVTKPSNGERNYSAPASREHRRRKSRPRKRSGR